MAAVRTAALHGTGAVMSVQVNGKPRPVPAGTTLGQLVMAVTGLPAGVAAAVNGAVVPRAAWDRTPLRDGDQVEVVTAVTGG
jgi:sulfur carrier protein